MNRVFFLLTPLLGVVSCSYGQLPESEVEVTVTSGDNITLYCDCKTSSGTYIVWFRNCSHENQPSLILRTNYKYDPAYLVDEVDFLKPFPHLRLVDNQSSYSYDLLIMNITDSDEGLYYCGTEQKEIDTKFSEKYIFKYGNIKTRILLNSSGPHNDIYKAQDCHMCWKLLFALGSFAVLSSLLCSLLLYKFCQKAGKKCQDDMKRCDSQSQIKQDGDVCYAALEIRQASQRPKKKKIQSSDFTTYSAINTSTF